MKLEEEGGITAVSLRNAEKLIEAYGAPFEVRLILKKDDFDIEEQVVEARWDYHGFIEHFYFTGFSWGYYGEGPHGLLKFLNMCGIEINMEEIGTMEKKEGRIFQIKKEITKGENI